MHESQLPYAVTDDCSLSPRETCAFDDIDRPSLIEKPGTVTLLSDVTPTCLHPSHVCNRLACPLAPSPAFPPFYKPTPHPAGPSNSPVTFTIPTLATVIQHLPAILFSVVPYLLFLLLFAANPYIHVLLTADDVTAGARLHNVSAWESHVMPFAVHRFVSARHWVALDLMSTVPYMLHYVIPVLFPLYLVFTDRWRCVSRFYKLLGYAMWIHYAIWYLLPTAPPWAYSLKDLPPQSPLSALSTLASTDRPLASSVVVPASLHSPVDLSHREGAAFARVDALTGLRFFYNMFHGNPVPFAAFPSGHVAWPTCILLIGPPGGRLRFSGYVLLVAWATLYSNHHYIFDALAAVVVVLLAYGVLSLWDGEDRALGSWRNRFRLVAMRFRRSTAEQNQTSANRSNGKDSFEEDDKMLPV